MSELINTHLVALDAHFGDSKDEVISSLAGMVAAAGRSDDADGLASDAFAREAKSATGMPGGLAIPHCRSERVTEATLVFARLAPAVDFGAKDGAADLVFMIAAPASGDQEHLKLLTKLARALVRPDFTEALRASTSPDEVVDLVSAVVAPPAEASGAGDQPGQDTQDSQAAATASTTAGTSSAAADVPQVDTIVAVTACPTGIAHTYMAAESLATAGQKAGVTVHVEPQGSVGAETLDPALIAGASAVIFATDVGVRDKDRFAGLPEVSANVKSGIHEADALIAQAIAAAKDPSSRRVSASNGEPGKPSATSSAAGGSEHIGTKIRTALLTGVSYMIPFVAAGGLLIALGFLLGGYDVDPTVATTNSFGNLPEGGLLEYLGAVFLFVGKAAFGLFIPALAGYIAYAIADRPGIAPGFVVGLISGGEFGGGLTGVGAGFLGAIVGGLLAGVVALYISRLKVPAFARGLMPVVVIPLFTTLIAGGLMVAVLGRPLARITDGLQDWLTGMSGSNMVLLGIVLGAMMAFDMGGPVNKAAYAFATAGIDLGNPATLQIMAAVMAAGMVPPLSLALASVVAPGRFTVAERENGKAAWLLGASFITEGAIPFAAADPLRVIPAIMLGGATTGALAMGGGVELTAPHGGIFVLFAMNQVLWFLLAIVVGTVVGAAAVIGTKHVGQSADRSPAPATA